MHPKLEQEVHKLATVAELLNEKNVDGALAKAKELNIHVAHNEEALREHLGRRYKMLITAALIEELQEAGEDVALTRRRAIADRKLQKVRSPYVAGLSPAMQDQIRDQVADRPERLVSGTDLQGGVTAREKLDRLFGEGGPEHLLDGVFVEEDIPLMSKPQKKKGREKPEPERLGTVYARVLFKRMAIRGKQRNVAVEVMLKKSKKAGDVKSPTSTSENFDAHVSLVDVDSHEPLAAFTLHPQYAPNVDPNMVSAPLYRGRVAGRDEDPKEPRLYAFAPDAIAATMARISSIDPSQPAPPRVDRVPTMSDDDVEFLGSPDFHEPENRARRMQVEGRQRQIDRLIATHTLANVPGDGSFHDAIKGIDWKNELQSLAADAELLLAMAEREESDPTLPLQPVNMGVRYTTSGGVGKSRHKDYT